MCLPVRDLTGYKIGLLTVIKLTGRRTSHGVVWLIKCECGRFLELAAGRIKGSFSKNRKGPRSCGCYHRRSPRCEYKGIGDLTLTKFHSIKNSALKRNYVFDITLEYVWDLFLKQDKRCALSGEAIHLSRSMVKGANTASLDRIDNNYGYLVGNVQWVHVTVNYLKSSYSEKEFVSWCTKVADTQRNQCSLGVLPRSTTLLTSSTTSELTN
jgi:hypothetical protein